MREQNKARIRIDAKVRRFSEVYARMKLNGHIDYDKLVRIWNVKEQKPVWKCQRLLKTKVIRDQVTEKLIELTEKHGITAQQSLEARKRILDIAIEKGDLTNANKALDSFDVKLDLHPIKQQQITTTETNYLQLLSKDKGTTKQITAKQTKELQPSTSTSTENSKETSQNDADNE